MIFFASDNTADIPPIVFAAFCLGCPVMALYADGTKRELLHLFNLSKPKFVFCDKENYGTVKESIAGLNYEPKLFTFGVQPDDSRSIESLFRNDDADPNRFFM